MEKEFVPYDLAVKLNVFGFDEPCFGRYYYKKSYPMLNPQSEETELVFEFGQYLKQTEITILAPLYQQAFRWFREKYGMYSHIKTSGKISVLEFTWVSNGKYGFFSKDGFETYEEAELACLEKLIEIVET